jgi:hypothetical protein
MDWCIASNRKDANHHPNAVINCSTGKSVVSIAARPGQTVTLSAAGSSDPDGDNLTCRWFQYAEAGNGRSVTISKTNNDTITFQAPNEPGKTIHIILELRDDGKPNLLSYRRVVVTISGSDILTGE